MDLRRMATHEIQGLPRSLADGASGEYGDAVDGALFPRGARQQALIVVRFGHCTGAEGCFNYIRT